MEEQSALIVVDVQVDFCPGGALAIPNGDAVVPVVNKLIDGFAARGLPIYISRDWHPANTKHFADFGGKWPVHCVQATKGADFHKDLRHTDQAVIVSKGQSVDRDDYSATQAVTPDGTPLPDELRRRGIKRVVLGGLATEYCVRDSAIEFKKEGFEVTVVLEACRALDDADAQVAIDEMTVLGIDVMAKVY